MCCIFTCCGWIVDLIQRVWTFSMSCIIISAVGGVMMTSSMSGIALGYNYSLAEYIDLKETNVSVYLKRGVFDDEIADDMDWRRAGHLPVAGHINEDNLRTGAPADDESTTQRSGRRLEDSVVEAEDQNKYEGFLMKLTAKPVYQDIPKPKVTDDLEMSDAITKHPSGSLDQLKAIQSLIDSRRAMATGGTTASPLAIYQSGGPILPYLPSINNPNLPMNLEFQSRRMMAPDSIMQTMPPLNPARLAVPDPASLESKINWLAPKRPAIFVQSTLLEFLITSPTYPTAVTMRPAIVRPTELPPSELDGHRRLMPGAIRFPYPFSPKEPTPTQPPTLMPAGQEQMDKQPDFYNEKFLAEGNEMSKNENMKMRLKSPEEEYEDEIKGLPVRKRRSIITSILVGEERNPSENKKVHTVGDKSTRENGFMSSVKNIFTTTNPTENNKVHTVSDRSTRENGFISSVNNIFTTTIQTSIKEVVGNYENNFTIDKNKSVIEEIADSHMDIQILNIDNTKLQRMGLNEKRKVNLGNKVDIIRKPDLSENKKGKSLLDQIITLIGIKKASLAEETTSKAELVTSTAKKISFKTKRRSFESKIVSSKYVPSNIATRLEKKQPFSNQEILDSISVGLNEAGLLTNPASSTFVKLLLSTLTA